MGDQKILFCRPMKTGEVSQLVQEGLKRQTELLKQMHDVQDQLTNLQSRGASSWELAGLQKQMDKLDAERMETAEQTSRLNDLGWKASDAGVLPWNWPIKCSE